MKGSIAAVATGAAAKPSGGRARRSVGVVLVQALNSLSTVVQIAIFAIVLPRGAFDDYAVWFTSAQFFVGVGQAVGSDRVVIGRRSRGDGIESAWVLSLVIAAAQLAIAVVLMSPTLMICSLAAFSYVTYDYQRMVGCFDEPRLFLRRDTITIAAQVTAVIAADLVVGATPWLAAVWWGVGAPLWLWFSPRRPQSMRAGLRVLREDVHESLPLLFDAVLAGGPVVVVLVLANAQGTEGNASAARMALTILGPITVLAMAGRRLVYAHVASDELSRRFVVQWAAVVMSTLFLCLGLLSLTRTPLYPWAFPGFDALPWLAILGFSLNHSAFVATFLPAATLRARGMAGAIGAARVLSSVAVVVTLVVLLPITTPGDVGWTLAVGSIASALALYARSARAPRMWTRGSSDRPLEAGEPL